MTLKDIEVAIKAQFDKEAAMRSRLFLAANLLSLLKGHIGPQATISARGATRAAITEIDYMIQEIHSLLSPPSTPA